LKLKKDIKVTQYARMPPQAPEKNPESKRKRMEALPLPKSRKKNEISKERLGTLIWIVSN